MKRFSVILIISVLSLFFITCNSLNDSDTATVTIDTGIRTSKAAAPSDLTSISVTVSGEGMADMTRSIPTDTGIRTFEVPVGSARLFNVTAAGENFTYLGSATQDIIENEEVNINLSMVRQAGILDFPYQSDYIGTTESFTVTISIPETGGSIEYNFAPDDTTTKYVPSGDNREITITATPLSDSAVVSFSTESTAVDFITGESTSVTLPTVNQTKIVIPDYQNDRIVQIDDMTGANLTELSVQNPYDVDFDSAGRIYIARNDSLTSGAVIHVLNNMTDTISTINALTIDGGYIALAIDRINNYLYYASSSQLYRYDFTNETVKTPDYTMGGITIQGISNDNNGIIYIAGNNGTGNPSIMMYDTNANGGNGALVDANGFTTNITDPWDTLYKDNSVYVANNYVTADGFKILQLNEDLSSIIANFGNTGSTTDPLDFYGPRRFVAILNDPSFVLLDDSSASVNLDKVVSFNDMTGAGWQTYGNSTTYYASDLGFDFYWIC